MATNVISYISNLGKSVVYTAQDKIKDMTPAYEEFKSTNAELFKDVYDSVVNYRVTYHKTKKLFSNSKIYEAADVGFKATLEDIKTGKFYNKARMNALESKSVGMDDFGDFDDLLGGDDDFTNFDDFEDDLNFDDESDSSNRITRGDREVVSAINTSNTAVANAISLAIGKTGEYITESNKTSSRLLYTQNLQMNNILSSGMGTMNQNLGSLIDFSNNVVAKHVENSAKFYADNISLMMEQKELLTKLVNYTIPQEKTVRESNRVTYEDIASAGVPDLKEYMKAVKQNFESMTSMYSSAMSIGGDTGNPLLELVKSPLKFIPEMFINQIAPKTIEKSIKNLDKSFEGLFGSLMAKFNSMAKDEDSNLIQKSIGRLLGVQTGIKSIDTSQYEKGKVDWDGKSRKALIEVIPAHLSKIVSLLSGEPEKIYDYDRGKFIKANSMHKILDDKRKGHVKTATEDAREYFDKYMEYLTFNSKDEKKTLEKAIDTIFERIYTNGTLFQVNSKKDDDYTEYGVGEKEFKTFKAMFKNLPKYIQHQINGNIYNERAAESRQNKELSASGDSIIQYLLNDYNLNEFANVDKDGKILTNKKNRKGIMNNNLNDVVDKLGHNVFYYLQNMYKELTSIRLNMGNSVFGGFVGGQTTQTSPRDIDIPSDEKYLRERNKERNAQQNERDRFMEIEARRIERSERHNSTLLNYSDDDDIDKALSSRIKTENLRKDIKKDRENPTLIQKLLKAKDLSDKAKLIGERIDELTQKPVKFFDSIIQKADQRMYELVYGKEDNGRDVKGFLDAMMYHLNDTFDTFNRFLNDRILHPLADKFDFEGKKQAAKDFINNLFGVDDLGKTIKTYFFGDKDTGEEGLFTAVGNRIKEDFKGAFTTVKDSVVEVFSPVKDIYGNIRDKYRERFPKKEKESRDSDEDLEDSTSTEPGSAGNTQITNAISGDRENIKNKRKHKEFLKLSKKIRKTHENLNNLNNRKTQLDNWISSNQDKKNTTKYKNAINERKQVLQNIEKAKVILRDSNKKMQSLKEYAGNSEVPEIQSQTSGNDILNTIADNPQPGQSNNAATNAVNSATGNESSSEEVAREQASDIKESKSLFEVMTEKLDNIGSSLNKLVDIFSGISNDRPATQSSNPLDRIMEPLPPEGSSPEENDARRNIATNLVNLVMNYLNRNTGAYAEGGEVTETQMATVSKGETVLTNDVKNRAQQALEVLADSVSGQPDGTFKFGNISDNRRSNPKIDKAAETITDGVADIKNDFKTARESLFGKDAKLENEKFANATKDVFGNIKEYAPGMISHGLLGSGVSLITGAIGGPLLGAAVGAGTSIIKESDNVKNWLFGEFDDDYNRKGGVISRKVLDAADKYLPDMKKFGIAGGVSSLLLPGIGPLGGILLGSTIGFAKNNEKIQDSLFGEANGIIKKETIEKITKNLPRAALGAGLGLLAGPFGLAGNIILGSAMGFATGTDTFKDAIFGTKDEDGNYTSGLLPAIREAVIDPLKNGFYSFTDEMKYKIQTTMIDPLKSAVDPIKKEVSLMFTSIRDKIVGLMDNTFEKHFGVPLSGFLRDKVFKPIGNAVGGTLKKIGKLALGAASLPFRGIGMYGDHLRSKHIRSGNADYMTADERNAYRENHPFKMTMKGDRFGEFDEMISGMSNEDIESLSGNLKTLEDTFVTGKKKRKQNASKIAKKVDYYAGNKIAKIVMGHIKKGDYDKAIQVIERNYQIKKITKNQYTELMNLLNENRHEMQESMDNYDNRKEVRSAMFKELRKRGFVDINEKNAKKYISMLNNEVDKRKVEEAKTGKEHEIEELSPQLQKNHNEIVSLFEQAIEVLKGSQSIQQQSLEEQIAPSQIVQTDDDGGIRSFIRNNDKVNTDDITENDYEIDMHDDETRKSEKEEAKEENAVKDAINRITGNNNNEDEDGEKKEKKPSLFSKLLDMAMSTTVGKFIIGGIGAFVAQKVLEQFGSSLPEFLGKIFGFIKDAGAKAFGFGEGDNDTLEEHTLKWAGENIARGHVTNVGKAMVKKGAKSKGLFKKLGLVTSGAGIDTVSKLGAKTTSLYDKMDGGLRKGINKITGKIQDRAAMNPNGISAKIANKIGDTNVGAKVVDTVKAGPKGFLNGVGKKLGSLIGNQKMAEMGVGGMMKDALGSNQFIQTAVEQFNSFIKKIFTNPVVKSFLGDEKCLAMITKFAPKVAQTMMEQGAKQTPEMLAKIVGGSATYGIVNAAFAVYDFISGFRDAKNILSVTEEPTLGMKVGAGLLKAINGLFIITSLIPERLWVDLIMWIPELFGEKDMKLQKMRQQAKTDAKNYAKKNGKGSMSVAEYNKIQKDGEKKVNKKKGLLDRLKEGAGNFGAKVKEVASTAFNSVVGAVTGVFDWLTGNNKKKTASAPTAKSLPTATPVTTGFGEPHNPNPDPRPKASKMSKPQFRRPVANKSNISKPKKNKKERSLSTKEIKKINDKAVNTPKHWTEIFTGQAGKIHPHSEVPEVRNNFPYYYQFDELWNKQSINGYTIAKGGCGPSSVAMILSGILGQKITPMDTGRVAMDGGTWIKGQGAAHTMYKQLGNHYGVDVNEIGSFDEFMQMTNSNMPIAISGKGSKPFTPSGHIIAFVGKDANGNLMINDPGHLYDKTVFTPEEIKRAGYKRAWAFGPPGSLGNVQMPTEGAEEPSKPSIANFFSDLGKTAVKAADALFGFDQVAGASTASASALPATPTDSSQDPNAVAYGENTPVSNQKTDKEKGPNKDSIIYTGKDKDKNKGSNNKNPFDLGITLGKGGPLEEPMIKSFDINGKSTEFIKSDAKPKRLLPSMVKKLKLGMGGPASYTDPKLGRGSNYTDPTLGRGAGDTPGSTAPNVARKTVKSASEAPPTSGPAAQSGNIEGSRVKAFFTAYYPANNKLEGGFNDALGNKLNPRQNTCAAPKDVPFHSAVQVLGTNTLNDGKVFEVTDRGGAINVENGKYHFDLLYPDKTSANKWGTRDGEAIISKNAGFTSPINGAGSTGETSTDSSQDPNAVAGEITPVDNKTTNKEKGPNKDSIIYIGKDKDKGKDKNNNNPLGFITNNIIEGMGKGGQQDTTANQDTATSTNATPNQRPTVEQIIHQPLNKWQAITEQELAGWIGSKKKSKKPYRPEDAKIFMQASQAAQLDPRYLVAHSAEETGWGSSPISNNKFNFYGINATDDNPGPNAYSYTGIEDGVIRGATQISKWYTQKGQDTLYKMVHDPGGHNYASNPDWPTNIASIMSTAPYGGQWIQGGAPTGDITGATEGESADSPSIANFFSDLGNTMVKAADALFGFDKIQPDTAAMGTEGELTGEDGGNGIAYGTNHIADTWFTKKIPSVKSSPYGMRKDPFGKKGSSKHHGIDYATKGRQGDSIPSPLTGIVHMNMPESVSGGFGNLIVLKDKNGYGHFFAHMQNRSHLKEGQKVGFGQSVGKVGSTGRSTGAHLHYEVRKPGMSKGDDVDPNKYLQKYYPKSMDPANKDKVTASPHTPTGSINGINSPTPSNDPNPEPPKQNWTGSINGISTANPHGGKGGPEDAPTTTKKIRKRVSNSKAEILQRQREIYDELNNVKKGRKKKDENLGQGGAEVSFAKKPTKTRIENQKEFDVGTPYSSNKVPLSSYRRPVNNDKLLQVIIEILYKIANNTSSLSEIVSLLSKNLNLNISKEDAQKIKDNHDNRNLSYKEARKQLNSNPDPSNQMIMDILNQLATE